MEELLALLAASGVDAALIATLKAGMIAKKMAVRSETEETTFKANLLSSSKEEIIKEEKKTWMRRIEDDIKELTGLNQKAGEPYHEFMKRGFKKVQELKDAAEAKVTEFESADGGVWKTKYQNLEAQSKTAIEAKEKELADFKKVNEVTQRSVELNKIVSPMEAKFISEVPSYFNDYKASVLKDVLNQSAIVDGKLVMVDAQGAPMKDANLANILVENFLTEKFKDVIKTDKQQEGAGSKKPNKEDVPDTSKSKAKAGQPINVEDAPKAFANQGEIITYLGKKGGLQGTKEYNDAFDKLVTEKNVTKIF